MTKNIPLLSQGFNQCQLISEGTSFYVLKTYLDQNRFECELQHHAWFKDRGFLCPALLDFSRSKMTITFEYVEGTHPKASKPQDIAQCIEVISKIQTFGPLLCKNRLEQREAYLASLAKSLQTNSLLVPHESYLLSTLRDSFQIGIFKDAKPENWILTPKSKVCLLDFDDVRPSFFLSDLAQFLGYFILENKRIDEFLCLQNFLKLLGGFNSQSYFPLLLLAIFQSNLKKIKCLRDKIKIKKLCRINQIIALRIVQNMR